MERFRVFQNWDLDEDDGERLWRERGTLECKYSHGPSAEEVGQLYGVGQYLLIEDKDSSFRTVVERDVRAETHYREATDEERGVE